MSDPAGTSADTLDAAPDPAAGLVRCFCAHTCGAHGKWIQRRTYYNHKTTTQRQEAAGFLVPAPSALPGPSSSSRHRSKPPIPQRTNASTGQPDSWEDDSLEDAAMSQSPSHNRTPSPAFHSPVHLDARNSPVNDIILNSPSPPRVESPVPQNSDEHSSSEAEPEPEPAPAGDFVPQDFEITNKFIERLRNASLDSKDHGLDADFVERLRNPPEFIPELTPDERLSIDLFLSLTNASVEAYNSVKDALLRRHPSDEILSHFKVKKLVSELSGVTSIISDMCINTCLAYTGPFEDLDCCMYCSEDRYDSKGHPRRQFHTIPIGPQIQAIYRSHAGAEEMQYRKKYTQKILAEIEENDGNHISSYRDFFDGSDYIDAVMDGKIHDDDVLLMLSMDGAQLYRNKVSDCWMYIWIFLDRSPDRRYKKFAIYPGGFFPGPNKPKHCDSFLFVGLYHLSALQREGLRIWNSRLNNTFTSKPFLALGTADGPGMAVMNGLVGHVGKHLCRIYCAMKGRRKPQASHYYPARLLPDGDYNVSGCTHPDIDLNALLADFTLENAAERYKSNLLFVSRSPNKAQYEKRRLDTGISKPTIFSGLPPEHNLGIPAIFPLDSMHPILNLAELLVSLWRGQFECAPTDDRATWDWAVLTGDTWKEHGQAVADLREFFPGSFDTPPRNPAEKINSGYKAWEHLQYLFGIGPALLFGVLPDKYYYHYCKLVRAFRLLFQEEILPKEVVESNMLLTEFSDGFETLYCQRRVDRLHFVRPIIHTISHLPGETIRKGPVNLYSQWAMERTIGNLGEEIKQHSDPYANLAQRGIRRAQVNALKAFLPDLTAPEDTLPRGSVDIGDGYVLLRPMDSCARDVRECEEDAIRLYIRQNYEEEDADEIADSWNPNVIRWARVRLPNGQITKSSWKEESRTTPRRARVAKIKIVSSQESDLEDAGDGDEQQISAPFEFAEILFYMILKIGEVEHYLALGSFYGDHDTFIYEWTSYTYCSMQHQRDTDVRAFKIKHIHSCVFMGPDNQYELQAHLPDAVTKDRWFLYEKSGLKLAQMTGYFEEDVEQ